MTDRHSQLFSLRPADPKHTPATHGGNTACCAAHFLQTGPSINWSKPTFQPYLPTFISHVSILHRPGKTGAGSQVPWLGCVRLRHTWKEETLKPSPMSWCSKTTQPLLLKGSVHRSECQKGPFHYKSSEKLLLLFIQPNHCNSVLTKVAARMESCTGEILLSRRVSWALQPSPQLAHLRPK